MPYKDLTPPAGEKITRTDKLNVPDHPVIPFIRGDGTGPDIWAASVRVMDAAVEKAYGGKKKISWFEVFAGQAAKDKFDNWLPDDTVDGFPRISGRDQGSADDAGRRRHQLAQCRAAADARSLRLPAPGAMVRRGPSPVKHPGEGEHGDLPREHRGHLRRDRMGRRHAGSEEGARVSREGISEDSSARSASARSEGEGILGSGRREGFPERRAGRRRDQAGQLLRQRAPDPQRDQLRDPEQAQERDPGAQGEHHEVHRGRVSRLGL